MIIGITGNIGSGKSMAAAYLAELGAAVIDADKVGHDVILPGGSAYPGLVEAFGEEFLDEDGHIIRKKLGAHVFSDASGQRVQLLNRLTHPHIRAEIQRQIEFFQTRAYSIIVIEAALLLDSPLIELIDKLWLLRCSPELAAARAARRDACTEESILQRRKAQRDQDELACHADLILENDGRPEDLQAQLKNAYQQALEVSAGRTFDEV
ncbi:MAG: dephospho-CoA kinase [Bacillota bacterium]|nr:dephospho-CoA kinase [Bacillota bacterium]